MDYLNRYQQWLDDASIDVATKNELREIANDDNEVKERFYKELEFGTGGLRGVIGAGSNRLNRYTVGKATQGLANYIKREGTQAMGVAIAYDCRNMSPEFAEIAGLVLAGNGIRAYVFPSLRPTPMLSFAVRHLGCTAGIVVTASHNPPEYNGYKVYWADGAQVVAPRDEDIIGEVNAVADYGQILSISMDEAREKELYAIIGHDVDGIYDENVQAQRVHPEITEKMGNKLNIIYTPIHGSGNLPVRRNLDMAGYENVFVVAQQEMPDATFRTVGYPNPEDPKVFKLAIELAEQKNADIILGTDPDCDRVGAVVKNDKGEYVVLTGNMLATLLTEYLLSQKKATNTLPANGAVIKTIVSTEMVAPICAEYGVKLIDVLPGFKFIGEQIKGFEKTEESSFLFGFEESYGCLAGTYARDKDAVVACLLACEMAAYYKQKGMTLYEGLLALYEKYGYYLDAGESIVMTGLDGVAKIAQIMQAFRDKPMTELGGIKTAWAKDYKSDTFHQLLTGETEANPLPSSNTLYYTLEDGTWVCIRPSGTEPKIKFYFGVKGESLATATEKLTRIKGALIQKAEEI